MQQRKNANTIIKIKERDYWF